MIQLLNIEPATTSNFNLNHNAVSTPNISLPRYIILFKVKEENLRLEEGIRAML